MIKRERERVKGRRIGGTGEGWRGRLGTEEKRVGRPIEWVSN